MFFAQSLAAPIVIEIGAERLSIEKFTLDDFALWASELEAAKESRLTKGMDSETRFRYLNFYDVLPIEMNSLKAMVRSPAGIKKILATCLPRGKVIARKSNDAWQQLETPEPISAEAKAAVTGATLIDRERLAVLLADLVDQAVAIHAKQEVADADSFAGEKGKAAESPLAQPGATE